MSDMEENIPHYKVVWQEPFCPVCKVQLQKDNMRRIFSIEQETYVCLQCKKGYIVAASKIGYVGVLQEQGIQNPM